MHDKLSKILILKDTWCHILSIYVYKKTGGILVNINSEHFSLFYRTPLLF